MLVKVLIQIIVSQTRVSICKVRIIFLLEIVINLADLREGINVVGMMVKVIISKLDEMHTKEVVIKIMVIKGVEVHISLTVVVGFHYYN